MIVCLDGESAYFVANTEFFLRLWFPAKQRFPQFEHVALLCLLVHCVITDLWIVGVAAVRMT